MISSKFFGKVAAACAAIGLLGTGMVAADDMNAPWLQLHEAIRIAELCENVTHDRDAWKKMGSVLDAKVDREIGAGERLTLIEEAKTDARLLVWRKGCDSDEVQSLAKLYDDTFATILR